MGDKWTPQELSAKIDVEGGLWDFYRWGGFRQTTGVPEIDVLLRRIRAGLKSVDSDWRQLQELLPEPWEGED